MLGVEFMAWCYLGLCVFYEWVYVVCKFCVFVYIVISKVFDVTVGRYLVLRVILNYAVLFDVWGCVWGCLVVLFVVEYDLSGVLRYSYVLVVV